MKKAITCFFNILILCFLCTAAWGQTGALKGFVYDKSNGEPISYAVVQFAGTAYGCMTEKNGGYMVTRIPDGDYTVQISFIGYDSIVEQITIKGDMRTHNFYMEPTKTTLESVSVSAERHRVVTETRTSVISVTAKDIKQMPAIGGTADFAQYLQILPGIVSTGDQGGQLYVRGGTPIQNMLMLDGMLIYNPFHSIGLFSVFDSDIISSADVYTGGFGAEFGGRLSSVMDIRTRDGNKKHISGKIDINTFGAKLLLEGPFIKLREDRGVALSYILSVKGSYLEHSSKVFYPYIEQGLPYNYLDLYGKLSLTGKTGTKLNLFGFRFDDKVNYSDVATYHWKNWGAGANFLIIPGKAPMMIEGTVAYTNYRTSLDDKAYKPIIDPGTTSKDTNARQSTLSGFNVNLNFSYYIGKSLLSVGAEVVGYTARYIFFGNTSFASRHETVDYTTDIGLFVKYKYNYRDKLLIEPSFRLQYYASLSVASPEPRLSLKWNITPNIRLKLAGGLYSQNFVAATSDRDVVNLFSGFLSSPGRLPDTTVLGKEVRSSLQKAQHVILGLELDVIPYTTINIEGYFKNFSVLTSLNRYKMFNEDPDYMFEAGQAYGGDITVDFKYKGLLIKAVYSLGWVTRYDGKIHYKPHYDRRHNVNLLASYGFGKRRSWQIDVRWNFGSGFPYTQTQSYYGNLDASSFNIDYITANEGLNFMLADYNGGRLPNYHRLDISAKKAFHIGERHTIEASVGVTNVYNYKNIFYQDRITNKTIYQLPILYSIGLSWHF